MYTSTNFTLRGGDAAFANRQQLLFDQLSIAESQCNKHDKFETDEARMDEREKRPASNDDQKKQKRETKRFRGKESIFKRPEVPAPRTNFKNIPDHHKNPHKWIKYSLDDVSSEDMTERSNMQAAMSFLRELETRNRREEVNQCEKEMEVEPSKSNARDSTEMRFKLKKCTSSLPIIYRKPQMKETAVITELDEKPIFRSSKIILPEYVIGQKPKSIQKQNRPLIKVDRLKLRLDHLQEEEEDD